MYKKMNSDITQVRGDAAASEQPSTNYVEAVFAFEIHADPWQMQLVDFSPYPTQEAYESFFERAADAGHSILIRHVSDGSEGWNCFSSLGLADVKKVGKFAFDLYQRWSDVGLEVPSDVRGDNQ